MNSLHRALELRDQIIADRRYLHEHAELGFDLPETTAYVKEKLAEMGIEAKEIIKGGVSALIGGGDKGGKTFLLRADMDALPIPEESDLPFAASNGNSHSCGHDAHTAMLLGAARILKERETELKGGVTLMFQPAEELLSGAGAMIAAGVLKDPKADCAMMLHISSVAPKGIGVKTGPRFASSDNFKITVKGKGTHGAMPEKGVDPILIGSHIVIGIQELVSREISFAKSAILTIGHFEGGKQCNIIPSSVCIEGSMRTFDNETRQHLVKRLPEAVDLIARTYRGEVDFEYLAGVPVLVNEERLTNDLARYARELAGDKFEVYTCEATTGSEDFALVAEHIPACMFSLGAPDPDPAKQFPLHNAKVSFDESALPIGAAVMAECAFRWLEEAG